MPNKPDRFWSFFETTFDGESAEELNLLGYYIAIPSHLFGDPPMDGCGELFDWEFCSLYCHVLPYNTIPYKGV